MEWQDTQTGVFTRFSTIPGWKSPRTHVRQYEYRTLRSETKAESLGEATPESTIVTGKLVDHSLDG